MCLSSPDLPKPTMIAEAPPLEETKIEEPEYASEERDVARQGIRRLMIPLGTAEQNKSGVFIPNSGGNQ